MNNHPIMARFGLINLLKALSLVSAKLQTFAQMRYNKLAYDAKEQHAMQKKAAGLISIEQVGPGQQEREKNIRKLLGLLPLLLTERSHLSAIQITSAKNPDITPNSEWGFSLPVIDNTENYYRSWIMIYGNPKGKIKGEAKSLWEMYAVYFSIGVVYFSAAAASEGWKYNYTMTYDGRTETGKMKCDHLIDIITEEEKLMEMFTRRYGHDRGHMWQWIAGDIFAAYFLGFIMSDELSFEPLPDSVERWVHSFIHSFVTMPS